jgi:hypothetical protein
MFPYQLLRRLMAKRNTDCFLWRRLGNAGTVWLMPALMVVLFSGKVLRAANSVPSNSASSNAITASLEFQETSYSLITSVVSVTTQTTPFQKEPAAASGKTLRGVLNFGGDSSNSIPFLWRRDAGKLYLDLNRNRDLTDVSSGLFLARAPGSYETSTNVHLSFNTASGKFQVLADITLYDYGSQLTCNVAVRSFWQGKLTLNGREWQAGIVQSVWNQNGPFESGRLLLRPWEKRNQPFTTARGSLATVPFSRKLFVDGRAYQVDLTAAPKDGEAGFSLQFTEQSVPLGELRITGQFIQRLVLPGGAYLVVLDQPEGLVQVPTGAYNQPDILLEQKGAEAFPVSGLLQGIGRISVDGKTTAVLDVGGPLTNSVTASRQGQDLTLDYCLVGAGGQAYQLAARDPTKPPAFAIYKGDKKIASGDFEFG